MRVTLFTKAFPDLRAFYTALTRLDRDGWDVEAWPDGFGADAYHPGARTPRMAALRLAMAGVAAWRCGYVADGPGVISV